MNPRKGALYAEALPSEWVVETCAPFMGRIISEPMPWSPESTQFTELQVKSEKDFNRMKEEKKNGLVTSVVEKIKQKKDVSEVVDSTSSSEEEDEVESVGSPDNGMKSEMMKMIMEPGFQMNQVVKGNKD